MMRFTAQKPRTFRQPPGRENARWQTEYASITGIVAQKTDKAILLTSETLHAWIPLFRLDAASSVKIYRTLKGSEITVRVELDFALKEKLV